MDEALRLTRNHLLESRTSDERALKRVSDLLAKAERLFDVSKVPPDAQSDVSRDAAHYLYEVLSRIDLPPDAEIPDANAFAKEKQNARWTVPHTEITLVRIEEGLRAKEFLLTAETVARAREFHERTRHLPYLRDVPLTNVVERRANLGGLLIPPRLIEQLPDWTKQVVLGQGLWKWLTIAIVPIVGFTGVCWVHRLAHAGLSGHGVGTQLRRLTTPVIVLLLMQFLIYLTNELLAASGGLAEGVTLAAGAVTYLAGGWAA
jgi:MscS family membrane protein